MTSVTGPLMEYGGNVSGTVTVTGTHFAGSSGAGHPYTFTLVGCFTVSDTACTGLSYTHATSTFVSAEMILVSFTAMTKFIKYQVFVTVDTGMVNETPYSPAGPLYLFPTPGG